MRFIFNLSTQLFTLAACLLAHLAYQYMTQGFGIHPFLSLPTATVCLLLPHLIRRTT